MVLKQPLTQLRVEEVWKADVERMSSEVAALEIFHNLTPGAVPKVFAYDVENQIAALELLPADSRNWQAEIAAQRVHPEFGGWAGTLLATWHVQTLGGSEFPSPDRAFNRFEQLRLRPFHETVIERCPQWAGLIRPYLAELRSERICVVSGDFAPKNTLISETGKAWAVDFEVAHIGNPVFDVAFFLSFIVLSAVQWPAARRDLRHLGDEFLTRYMLAAQGRLPLDGQSVAGHAGCLVLARTDGLSPAAFLTPKSRELAREVAIALLNDPKGELWAWI
jgi:5-methylthioribose kinase